jgi:hypothetical protein
MEEAGVHGLETGKLDQLCKVDPSNQQVAVGLTIIMCSFNDKLFLHIKGLSMRGGSAGTSVRDPESQGDHR